MALLLAVAQGVAFVPLARSPARSWSAVASAPASAAAPRMIFGLGGQETAEVKDIVVERSETVEITPEPGYANPGKATFTEMELAEQSAKLDALATKWRKRQQKVEDDAMQQIGFAARAEAINGRMAMFFLLTGLITEYYTGESIPGQVVVMLQTLGFVDF